MDLKTKIGINRPLWWFTPFVAIVLYGAAYAYVNPDTRGVAAFTFGQLIVLAAAREGVQRLRERREEQYFSPTQYGVLTVLASILIPVGSITAINSMGYISLVQGYVNVKILLVVFAALPAAVYNHIRGESPDQPAPS